MWLLLYAASAAALAAPEWGATASWNAQAWLEAVGTSNRTAVEVAGLARWQPGVEVGVGARRLFSPTVEKRAAWEWFVAGRVGPRVGHWSPVVGVEAGVTGALQQDWDALEEGFFYEERVEHGIRDVLYASVGLAPVRFRFGPALLEAGALSFGSSLPSWGRAVRFELVALRAGAVW